MKNRKGFTLAEIIVSFVVVSLFASMVAITLSNLNAQLGRERARTVNAFTEQGEIEQAISKVEDLVSRKLELIELSNSNADKEQGWLQEELGMINDELGAYKSQASTVNGQRITMYKVEIPRYNAENQQVSTLTSWVVESKGLVFPIPQIDKLTINVVGESSGSYGVDKIGKAMESKATYGLNKENLFTEQYIWYMSRPGFHMVRPEGAEIYTPEEYIGSRYPGFSANYEYITNSANSSTPSETSKRLSLLRENMKGRFVIAGLRATIREGKIGPEASSNPYYLANYPLPFDQYVGAVDASLISKFSSDKIINEVAGLSKGLFFTKTLDGPVPEIEPHGDKTGKIIYKGSEYDTYSRYFKFSQDNAYDVTSNRVLPNSYTLYIVTRQNDVTSDGAILRTSSYNSNAPRFMLSFNEFIIEEQNAELNRIQKATLDVGDGKWHVLAVSFDAKKVTIYQDKIQKASLTLNNDHFSRSNTLRAGRSSLGPSANMDVAEIVIANSVAQVDINNMLNHLVQKYGIS